MKRTSSSLGLSVSIRVELKIAIFLVWLRTGLKVRREIEAMKFSVEVVHRPTQ